MGKLLDSKGYGIAFTPGSLYRVPISSAILQLQVKLLLLGFKISIESSIRRPGDYMF